MAIGNVFNLAASAILLSWTCSLVVAVPYCRFCVPAVDDPLKCQNLELSSPSASCSNSSSGTHDVCATILFPATEGAFVSMRGCARLLETESLVEGKQCMKWADIPNFYFTPAVVPKPDKPPPRRYEHPGTDEERKAGAILLKHLFPGSDPTRALRSETPIKNMLTFYNYPNITVCLCQDDNCNGHLSSGSRSVVSLAVFAVISILLMGH